MTNRARLSGEVVPEEAQAGDIRALGIVIVTYNPDLQIVERQLQQLPSAATKVVIDNASRLELQDGLREVVARCGATLLRNEHNVGLASALNQGCRFVHQVSSISRYLLLLDQDSEPGNGGVERLLAACIALEASSGKPCCVGPRLLDVETGLEHGFHQMRGWRWTRIYLAKNSREVVPLSNLNGSGTLMSWSMFSELGGLDDEFFIDHVDTEWAFRVLARGWGLFGVPNVTFRHRMGEKSFRFWWFGWRVWPYRSPSRHFYLFRNTGWLLRRDYVPFVWKFWAIAKLGITFLLYALFDRARGVQLRNMLRGIVRSMAKDGPSQ